MVSFHLALVAALLFSSPLNAIRLSFEENKALQIVCGTNMKEVDRYSRKVLNGVAAHSGETPWSMAVYIPDHKNEVVYTTGTLVSNRHIISYDQLFVLNTTHGIKYRHNLEPVNYTSCGDDATDLVLPKSIVKQVAVYANMLKADRFSGKKELQVKSVRILNGCQIQSPIKHVAIIELMRPIQWNSMEEPAPICVGSDTRPNEPFTFYGFGDNRGEVMDATLRHTTVTEVPCGNKIEAKSRDEFFCVKSEHNLCNGDFGGAAVKKMDGSIRAFGVYIEGPYECAKANKDTVYIFANLTHLANTICKETGICASYLPKPTTSATIVDELIPGADITTLKPQVAGDRGTEHPQWPISIQPNQGGSGQTTPMTNGTGGRRTTTAGPGNEPNGHTRTTRKPTDGSGTTTRGHGTGQEDSGTQTNTVCTPEIDDDDIHIHIKLGKYIKTGDENDIEIIRQGPRKPNKRSI